MEIESILAKKGRNVLTVRADLSVHEAMLRLRREGVSALVVSDDGVAMAGVITDRGIIRGLADRGVGVLEEPVESVMVRDVVTCRREDTVDSVMAIMTERRIRHVPVIEQDRLCGIISIGDVVKHRLDEIQGEADAMRDYIARAHMT